MSDWFKQVMCEKCGDTIGPWTKTQDWPSKITVFVCENCWTKIERDKNRYETANILNTRHAR